jgi:hypothetical protein
MFVTTTESPPPESATFVDAGPTGKLTVPVGRNGLTEPCGIFCPNVQPMCSTMTARLKAALVAVGTVVGFVVVSDGAQKPPIQYQD